MTIDWEMASRLGRYHYFHTSYLSSHTRWSSVVHAVVFCCSRGGLLLFTRWSSVVHTLSDPAAGIPGEEPHCSVCQEEWDQSDSSNHGNRILICGKCGIGESRDINKLLVHTGSRSEPAFLLLCDSDLIYFSVSSTNI